MSASTSIRQGSSIGLGVFSMALGVPPLAGPERTARAAGLRTTPGVLRVLRAIGLRELVVGTGLLVSRNPGWLWARVAQDVMDVPLSAAVTTTKDGQGRVRMARVTAFLVAVTAVDVVAAVRATRAERAQERTGRKDGQMTYRAAVTIRRDESEIRSRLPEADPPLSSDGTTVSFTPAPGGRGVEVRAVLEQRGGGPLGKVVGAVTGTDPERQLTDAMRRFKQLLETGEVIRSEGSPEGVSAPRTRKQRSAQPVAGAA